MNISREGCLAKKFINLCHDLGGEHPRNSIQVAHKLRRTLGKSNDVIDVIHHLVHAPQYHTQEREERDESNTKDNIDKIKSRDHREIVKN